MLKLTFIGNSLPTSFICDPSATFQPGSCAQLVVIGNQVMATVSNGTAPIGIIDDIRTKAFTNISWNEIVITEQIPSTIVGGKYVSTIDYKYELKRPNILPNSFTSSDIDVVLNANNGVITFVAGTELNFDTTGSGVPDAFRTIVNYTYNVASIPGDDSVAGTGRVTVWVQRMMFQTSMYETNVQYPVNANLYVNETGLFTTRVTGPNNPAVAMVIGPPSPTNPMLDVLWL